MAAAWAYDPTHGRMATLGYVTVAVGRDYRDVAPTSGTYSRGPSGRLTSRKRVEVTRLEYDSA
jgi:transglutaminase-like putative cysteine protease